MKKPIKKTITVPVRIEIYPDGQFFFDPQDVVDAIQKKLVLKAGIRTTVVVRPSSTYHKRGGGKK